MARIVAGSVGGRHIAVPANGTRPTTDRVREALFARLEHQDLIEGAVVADLYAGSGGLGLEAASRGAASVVLVEADRKAAQVCRDNTAALGLRHVTTQPIRVEAFLTRIPPEPFSLVFVDPPYDLEEDRLTAVLAALEPRLTGDPVVVVERASRSPEPTWPDGLVLWETRRYGETSLHLADRGASQA